MGAAPKHDITYFDPNTFGEEGYSLIGPLLLFYDKVVLYGPSGMLIEKSYHNNASNTSLTPREFVDFVLKGYIIPLGFQTFFDSNARNNLYLPEVKITTDFDKDLTKSSSAIGKKRKEVPNTFKIETAPYLAKEIIDSNLILRNSLAATINDENKLPQRYKDLKENADSIPPQL
ncbi:MAG: hypothetical protein D6E12_06470, partial [Desulfovibrio sp.]